MITQERIDEIAAEAVVNAVQELLDDRMCMGEILADGADLDHASEDEFEAELDRLEAAIRLHLPGDGEDEQCKRPHINVPPPTDEPLIDGLTQAERDLLAENRCSFCGKTIWLTAEGWKHQNDVDDRNHIADPANLTAPTGRVGYGRTAA